MPRALTTLSVATAIALLGLSNPASAENRVVNVTVRADSEHPGMEAFRAMDGNPGSMWQARWRAPMTELPHEIVVDLGAVYEITGFTYLPRTDRSDNGTIKDYEAYLTKEPIRLPLAKGRPAEAPAAKGAFAKLKGENVVTFAAPVKGRYFRLRALSEMNGSASWAGIAELRLSCEGVRFVGRPWSLGVKFPKAGDDVIALIEGFPLLGKLLELDAPWRWDLIMLKQEISPKIEVGIGSEEHPLLFIDRRRAYDWVTTPAARFWRERLTDWPGLKVWNQWSYMTDLYVFDPTRPVIRMHFGRPPTCYVNMMQVTFPPLPQSARKELRTKIEKVVEGLRAYGAKKLPYKHPTISKYLLPGGTRMTFSDFSGCSQSRDGYTDQIRKGETLPAIYMQLDFEPSEPRKVPAPLPAFPGAEGYGGFSRGGRGGKVYVVTTLDDYLSEARPARKQGTVGQASKKLPGYAAIPKEDTIPGSLREAVEAKGPRIVMFGVSGTIGLKAPLKIRNPYLTIVGHTAPGQGVQIRNWWFEIYTHDVVMRYLRVRVGDIKGPGTTPRVLGDQTQALDFTGMNIIVDHCEFAYANDQIVNIRGHRPTDYPLGTVRIASTFQWNYTYGGLQRSVHEKGNHSMSYAFAGYGYLSFHHNLTAHTTRRNPRLTALATDWRNNTLYNYWNTGYGSQPDFLKFNYVGNVQKRGRQRFAFQSRGSVFAHLYGSDNIGTGSLFIAPREVIMDQPWDAMPVKTDAAKVAYEKVLKYGGADLPARDVITTWVSDSVRKNAGNIPNHTTDWPHGGYATYKPAKPAPDADRDGMPDWWEKKHGLDPKDASDNAGDKDKDGYTNVEEYINDTDPAEFIDYRKPENNVSSLHRADTIHRRKKR